MMAYDRIYNDAGKCTWCGAPGGAETEIARLREALAFYAAPESWRTRGHPQIDANDTPLSHDGGDRARSALQEKP